MDARLLVQTQDLEASADWVPSLEYFVDRTCLPSWRIAPHPLVYHDLTWVLSGKATYWCDGRPLHAVAGDLLYLPEGAVRQAVTDPDDPMHCLACNFRCRNGDGRPVDRLPFAPLVAIGFPEGLQDLYRKLNQAWLEKGPGYPLEVRGLLTLILHALAHRTSDTLGPEVSPRLRLVQRHIVLHYAQAISNEELAQLVRLHPGYFGTWFRRQTGLTVHQYVNRIRIRKAVDLLSTGGFKVGEAADKCGFSDIFYFSKVFRRIVGRSPSELIREGHFAP